MKGFVIVKVDSNYCDYLRKFDNKVSYNAGSKELRPFIGVLFYIGKIMYFAPLSSPKEKHIRLKAKPDLIKIDDGKLGVVNLNNMIPVTEKLISLIDLNKPVSNKEEIQYIKLLKKQLNWLNHNQIKIREKALKLYNKYVYNKLNSYVKERCCNFKLLEEKCKEYND